MMILPNIEKITRDATTSHFLLMFGYKLFSFYFSLYLVAKGLSLHQVGYTYLLVYLPIALFSPVAGFLNHKINPAILSSLGIAGYGFYSFGLLFIPGGFFFYLLQVILGISAALFFVSSRSILMGLAKENPSRSFSWFYSAPNYADILAPAAGALLIFKFGFSGVFAASVAIHACNMVFNISRLYKPSSPLKDHVFFSEIVRQYKVSLGVIRHGVLGPIIMASLAGLITGGFYQAFFVLFLKHLGWAQNEILLFGTVSSLLFVPISWYVANQMKKNGGINKFFQGITLYSLSSIGLGLLGNAWHFFSMFLFSAAQNAGALMANSVRSGTISKSFAPHSEEAGAIDTILSPLGQSAGFLIGGFLLSFIGYPLLFAGGGVFVLIANLVAKRKVSV